MTAHTQTPWKIQHTERCGNILAFDYVVDEHGYGIAEILTEIKTSEEADANAAFIVRCCNSFDEALSLLKQAKEFGDESLRKRIESFLEKNSD